MIVMAARPAVRMPRMTLLRRPLFVIIMSLIVLLYDEHYYVDSSGVNTSEYKQQCCNQNNALSLELKAFLSFYSLRPDSPRSDSNGGVVSRENANLRLLIIFWAVLPPKK